MFNIKETEIYKIYTIFGIKITIKKKKEKSNIDKIVWWIPIKSLRNSIREIYYEFNNTNKIVNHINERADHIHNHINERADHIHNHINERADHIHNHINEINKNIIDLQIYITFLELVKKIHINTFMKFKSIHNNSDIVLVANGPSVSKYKIIKNAIHIGVNRAFHLDNIDLNYLFIQDGFDREYIKSAISYNKESCVKFFGKIDGTLYNNIPITIPEYFYEDKSIYKYILSCQFFNYDKLVYDLISFPLGDFASVIFPAIQFAFWTNPKRIFLVGCDSVNNGHFYDNKSSLNLDKILFGWNKVKEFQSIFYPNIEIISINPIGLKGMFKDIYIENDTYVDENGNTFNINKKE